MIKKIKVPEWWTVDHFNMAEKGELFADCHIWFKEKIEPINKAIDADEAFTNFNDMARRAREALEKE